MPIFSNQVNGHAAANSEHLTSNIDFFTILSHVDLLNTTATATTFAGDLSGDLQDGDAPPAGLPTGSTNVETALDKLMEIISQRGQPVIMGGIVTNSVAGTYTFSFATEHAGSWNVTGGMTVDNSAVDLTNAINAAGIDFGLNGNCTVTHWTNGLA